MNKENVTLYYKEGSSDKVYRAALEQSGGGWVVNFAYGRRGSTMVAGTKTASPVEYAEAKKIYDRLVVSKTGKGYTPGQDGTPYKGTGSEARDTGVRLQLLNDIDESELDKFISDDRYCAQRKCNGKRRGLIKQGSSVTGTNRNGLSVGIPETIEKSALTLNTDFVIDGESVGDNLPVFDLLELDGKDIRSRPYIDRYNALIELLGALKQKYIYVVETAITTVEKRMLLAKLRKENAEGIVFKLSSAPYTPGRPASGGTQLKCKFYATASAIVEKVNTGKRSIALVMYADGKLVSVGNVTVPPNLAIPEPNAIVEIRYLYAFPKDVGGTLYQPTLLDPGRDDVNAKDCTISQLKYHSPESDESTTPH